MEGFVQYKDLNGTVGESTGTLPDGNYGNETRIEFCCRDDAWETNPLINIPNTEPLVFIKNNKSDWCQEVAGTISYFDISISLNCIGFI